MKMGYAKKGLAVMVVALFARDACGQPEPGDEQREPVLAIVYQVSNLPLWQLDERGDAHFDATLIIAYIKDYVCPGAWDDGAFIAPSPKNSGVIVAQTRENHQKI